MKLLEAYEKAKSGDSLKDLDTGFELKEFKNRGMQEIKIPFDSSISEDWEIFSTDPKVLTAEEYCEEIEFPIYDHVLKGFKAGHQNGRLERDLEIKPLLKYIEEIIALSCAPEPQLVELLSDIPPLKKNEN